MLQRDQRNPVGTSITGLPGLKVHRFALAKKALLTDAAIVSVSNPAEVSIKISHHALNFLLAGQTRTFWHGHGFRLEKLLRPGQMTLIPGSSDAYRFRYDGKPRTLRVEISPENLNSLSEGATSPVELRQMLGVSDPLLWNYGIQLMEELECPGFASNLYVETLITALSVTLVRHYALNAAPRESDKPGLSEKQFRLVANYIAENLNAELDVEALAGVACLSKSHFLRSFKRHTGMTPHRFVIKQRVGHAQNMLRDTRLSIADIAYSLNFSSQSHFTTAFRRSTGMTPKAFRTAM